MKVKFNINFHTIWGQTLFVTGSINELGNWDTGRACPMQYTGDGNWELTLELPQKSTHMEYRYFMSSNDQLIFEEWQKNHLVNLDETRQTYLLFDYWQNRPQNMAFYSSAFTKSFFAHPCDKFERVVKSEKKILFKIMAPHVERDQSLAITGNQDELGNWDSAKATILSCEKFPLWSIEIDASQLSFPIEYKFLVINNEDKSVARWEDGDNRVVNIPLLKENEMGIVSGLRFRENAPDWKCGGLVVPVFSLKSEQSFGIGDFYDLKLMIDWAKATGQKVIQILPINDTTMTHTWLDSYPYNAISIYALHPLYLSLQKMGTLKDNERAEFYRREQSELNKNVELVYEKTDHIKWNFFNEIFEQEGEKDMATDEYRLFFEQNQEWLIPYAAYSYLRDQNQNPNFTQWGKYAGYDRQSILSLSDKSNPDYKKVLLYYYIQFHLHQQLSEVRNYAYANGVVLKGDIPIGISKVSVEAWAEPNYFNMDSQAGAPPDDFSVVGQNWGFPTYNWEEMEKDNYAWWKKRFRKMSDYFDAYRIDHILGFFRIWNIPNHSVQGLYAWFDPALPLSVHEIEYAGLHFDQARFTTPHINENFLNELFGDDTAETCSIFLDRSSSHHFALKEKFDTQQKIKAYFANKYDPASVKIRDGLYSIANEVLFIRDPKDSNKFHPRISASSSYMYRELSNSERYAFDYLYWNYFYHRHNEFWKEQGYKHLIPLISSTDMLVCGEDLGMIPQSVPEVMHKLQILSLEIERMPKEMNIEFANLHNLPYLSVCTSSTHDMSTIRGWWKEDREKTQRYYNQVLHREGPAPEECSGELCEQILMNHLNAPSMLTIIPLQDWLSVDEKVRRADCDAERINIPANPNHYWRYRMHLSIEDLLRETDLNEKLKSIMKASNRL